VLQEPLALIEQLFSLLCVLPLDDRLGCFFHQAFVKLLDVEVLPPVALQQNIDEAKLTVHIELLDAHSLNADVIQGHVVAFLFVDRVLKILLVRLVDEAYANEATAT